MLFTKNWFFRLLLPLVILLQACDEDGSLLSSRPSGVLSKKQMISIMVDIHLQEANLRSGKQSFINQDARNYTRKEYLKVFANHDVAPDDFRRSLDYYLLRVNDLDDIYTGVINRLTEMQSEMQGTDTNPPPKKEPPKQESKKPGEKDILKTPSEK